VQAALLWVLLNPSKGITPMKNIALAIFALMSISPALATNAENTKELPDEVRAVIIKELAIMKRFGDDRKEQKPGGDVVQVQDRQGSRHGQGRRSTSASGRINDDESVASDNSDESPQSASPACTMNVGNASASRPSASGRVTTVIARNIIQMCK
jgi:hypothetical protein